MMSCSAMPPSHSGDIPPENPPSKSRRDMYQVETTSDGDLRTFVVEPSFDAEETSTRNRRAEAAKEDDPSPRSSNQDAQSRSDEDDQQLDELIERRLSPTKEHDQPRTHSRNLSAHFFDAAKISDGGSKETFPVQQSTSLHSKQPSLSSTTSPFSSQAPPASEEAVPSTVNANAPPMSPAVQVGAKHHRGISGDMQSPAYAHRRINSIGNSAPVDKRYGGQHQQHYHGPLHKVSRDRPGTFAIPTSRAPSAVGRHQREDSAGLDMLTAAAMEDVSKEELARVAGPRGRQGPSQTPWEAPAQQSQRRGPMSAETQRSSPVTGSSGPFDYPQQHSVVAPDSYRPSGSNRQYPTPQQAHRGGYQGSASPTNMGYQYPPGPYHPHPPPYYPPPHYQHHGMAPSPTGSYPVQYSQPRGVGSDPYNKNQSVMSGEFPIASSGRQPSPSVVSNADRIDTDERLFGGGAPQSMGPPPNHWERPGSRGTTTGVQTHVTALSVGEDRRTIQPTIPQGVPETPRSVPTTVGHHRKLSSFSSLSGIVGNSLFPEGSNESQPAVQSRPVHHRVTSSSVSFLQGLDENDPFLQSLQAQSNVSVSGQSTQSFVPQHPRYAQSPNAHQQGSVSAPPATDPSQGSYNKQVRARALASGGTSKRIRRKCTVADCPNRVVQGGLCISHGAKRKTCKHPGCTKNVKKAGLCSTHGPARKRCNADGCSKVAVQGGKCIAHGAKKKLCSMDGCAKQAILTGMCKKHHDQIHGDTSGTGRRQGNRRSRSREDASLSPQVCVEIDQHRATPPPETTPVTSSVPKPNHRRGLSIFQEMSADSVKTILDGSIQPAQPQPSESFRPF